MKWTYAPGEPETGLNAGSAGEPAERTAMERARVTKVAMVARARNV